VGAVAAREEDGSLVKGTVLVVPPKEWKGNDVGDQEMMEGMDKHDKELYEQALKEKEAELGGKDVVGRVIPNTKSKHDDDRSDEDDDHDDHDEFDDHDDHHHSKKGKSKNKKKTVKPHHRDHDDDADHHDDHDHDDDVDHHDDHNHDDDVDDHDHDADHDDDDHDRRQPSLFKRSKVVLPTPWHLACAAVLVQAKKTT